eukprot:CAMPEP_0196680878 /NCGR_PEP_ID=MMETSP1090-20130531/8100_1 /TAXON_ID=37098 /ORGANISM="Isochrysis sp, Strain CCMP1244" /LENGTH=162 /DNA_ID=CAMNT_0042019209 /DNA_START=755 /DNA_END=1239 /DNA_ORIENTATION=-
MPYRDAPSHSCPLPLPRALDGHECKDLVLVILVLTTALARARPAARSGRASAVAHRSTAHGTQSIVFAAWLRRRRLPPKRPAAAPPAPTAFLGGCHADRKACCGARRAPFRSAQCPGAGRPARPIAAWRCPPASLSLRRRPRPGCAGGLAPRPRPGGPAVSR